MQGAKVQADTWLVCFDVLGCNRRRRRLARLLSGYGSRIQRSAWVCQLTPADLQRLRLRMRSVTDLRTDRVHVWRVPQPHLVWTLGEAWPRPGPMATHADGHLIV